MTTKRYTFRQELSIVAEEGEQLEALQEYLNEEPAETTCAPNWSQDEATEDVEDEDE